MQDKAGKLKELFSSNCVPLSSLGYTWLGECIADTLKLAVERRRDTAECVVSGVKRSYYLRGFNSIRGGSRSAFTASGYKSKPASSSAQGGGGFPPVPGKGWAAGPWQRCRRRKPRLPKLENLKKNIYFKRE